MQNEHNKKSDAFLHTNNEQSEKEINNSFYNRIKRIYSRINITEDATDLYTTQHC